MARKHLTPTSTAAFKAKANARAFLWDDEMPRLAVLARPSGTKTFVFKGTLNYRDILISLGSVGARAIESVRADAWRYQRMIEAGDDPRDVLRKESDEAAALAAAAESDLAAAKREEENRRRYTLAALCEAYCSLLESRGKPSARQARSILKVHVLEAHPEIAAKPAREVTKQQIAAMVRKTLEAGKDRTSGVLRSYLHAAFTAGRKASVDPRLPAALIPFDIENNPVGDIPAAAVLAGTRKLSTDELRDYLAALGDALPEQALLLALLSGGQRMAQLLRAKVGDYDTDTQTLRLWDAKGRRKVPREHLLPLAPRAAALVARLIARAQVLESTLLFSTHGAVQLDETTPGKRAAAICNGIGGERFDLRDIRRTCETILASMGISRDTRAQLLSHGLSGVQNAHYDMHSYTNEKRAALVAWEDRLHEIESGQRAVRDVVSLHAA